jgi:hypothetical protein
MNDYNEGLALLEEKFGHGRDNVITLATIAREGGSGGQPRPAVRGVNAYYEDRVFYVTTHGKSNKMLQIAQNPQVSVASLEEMFTASGLAEDLGWVMDPKNAELRAKLRAAFASWYDSANNEKDESCRILAIGLSRGTLNVNHWERLYHMNFAKGEAMENGGVF